MVWGGEFGRTLPAQGGDGRDHNNKAIILWMAGGDVKGATFVSPICTEMW